MGSDFLWHIFKKTNNKEETYLQIYSSFYDSEHGHTAHKSYKPIGYVHELQAISSRFLETSTADI